MGIAQLGCDVEFEVRVELYLLVPELDDQTVACIEYKITFKRTIPDETQGAETAVEQCSSYIAASN